MPAQLTPVAPSEEAEAQAPTEGEPHTADHGAADAPPRSAGAERRAGHENHSAIQEASERALEQEFLGNPVQAWLIALIMLLAMLAALKIVQLVLLGRLEKIARRTRLTWDDVLIAVLKSLRLWMMFPVFLYAATSPLVMPSWLGKGLGIAAIVGAAIQIMSSARIVVDAALEGILNRSRLPDGSPDPTLASSIGVFRVVVMFVLFTVVLLLGLDNLGFKITPLVTGLGIGGIAVALAVQNILSDLFGSLTIILDKPFEVGDSIQIGTMSGTVERIGIKTTRLRATSGEQLVVANSDLLTSRVQNFKRMAERRVPFTFGVIYETPPSKLAGIPGIVRSVVERHGERVRFDRCHLKTFGQFSLDFEAVYFVRSSDYNLFMDIQQAVSLDVLRRFSREGIEFAYPTSLQYQRQLIVTEPGGEESGEADAPTAARRDEGIDARKGTGPLGANDGERDESNE